MRSVVGEGRNGGGEGGEKWGVKVVRSVVGEGRKGGG